MSVLRIFQHQNRLVTPLTAFPVAAGHATDLAIQLSRVLLSNFHRTGVTAFDETRVISKVELSLSRRQFEKILNALRDVPDAMRAGVGAAIPEQERDDSAASTGSGKVLDRSEKAFIDTLKSISTRKVAGAGDIGLEGAVRDLIAKRRGGEMLFVVISDLISSRAAVVSAASLCRRTGNRMLVIQTYEDWYSRPPGTLDTSEAERLYVNMVAAIKLEAALRRAGASFIRIGPADTTARIVRSIRRGVA